MIRLNLDRTELLDNGLRYAPDAGILLAPVSRLKNDPDQPRKHFPQEDLEALRADIDYWQKQGRGLAATGFLEPLKCRWAPGSVTDTGAIRKNAKLIIWDGERRWRATKEDYEWLPVALDDLSAKEARSAALRTSIHKKLLLPIEEAHAFAAEMQEDGLSLRSMAKRYNVDKSYVENRLNLLKCPDDVQRFVSENPDKMTHGLAMRNVTDKAFRSELMQYVDHGSPVREVESLIQQKAAQDNLRKESQHAPDRETQSRQSQAAFTGSAPMSRGHQITAPSKKEASAEARKAALMAQNNLSTVEKWVAVGGNVPITELTLLLHKINELLGES